MTKLLLPYAINSSGNFVHIDNARKGDIYICPSCGANLSLRISKIPKGQKYHRPNHFAHKGSVDNYCSESFLHKLFKQRVAEYISLIKLFGLSGSVINVTNGIRETY